MDVAVGGTGVEVGGSVGTTVGVGCDVDVPHPASIAIKITSIKQRRDTANMFLLAKSFSPLSPGHYFASDSRIRYRCRRRFHNL